MVVKTDIIMLWFFGKYNMLRGAITAIVTPFKDNGSVDFDALDRLIEYQIAGGIAGIVVIGSTGEALSLDDEEKLLVVRHTINTVNKRVKIVVGIGFPCTNSAGKFVELANSISGIDYLLVSTPAYVKPSQEGMYLHIATIAKLSKMPIILYNVPARTSSNIEDSTILRLANDFSNIVGLKDATGDISRCCYMVKHKPFGFMLFTGDDATAMAFMLCGGDGVISVVSNVIPKLLSKLCNYALNSKKSEAIKVNNQIFELCDLMFIESNPIPIKWALFESAVISTPFLRLPLTILSQEYQDKIKPHLNLTICEENNVN